MLFRKFFAVLLIAVSVCFALAGCADPSGQTGPAESGGNSSTEVLPEQPADGEDREVTEMYIKINGNELKVTLADNQAVDALIGILKNGDITYTADDYGGFEKVGNIGYSLPRNDTQITAHAGDVILYQGNQIVLFYGSNSWSYTRIGTINGYSDNELRSLLGGGNGSIQVTLSLNGGTQK